ncbi:MAG TPA: VanZ family protein [Candidatus Nanoarchaeia archaeon]|nr:VanZ family protein [Candidatus Nanoarchaeia archaeon]
MVFLEKRYVSFIAMFLIALEIFYFSSIPGSAIGTNTPFISIAYHFIVFFLFSFFLFFYVKGAKKTHYLHIIFTIVLSIIYATLDEFHQAFVPLRSSSLGDVFTDSFGICISILLIIFISKKANRRL